jgi:hypothetical protein
MNIKNRKLIALIMCGFLLLMSVTWVGNTVSDSHEHDTDSDFEDGILENVELRGTDSDAFLRLQLTEDGSYATGFDFDGVIESNPSASFDIAYDVAEDLRYIYIVGYDRSPGDYQWRMEKRDKTSGSLVTAFDIDGVVESNPSTGSDYAQAIAVDSNYIYVAGIDLSPGNFQWRVEKRDKATGALVTAFDTDGVVLTNPSTNHDYAYSIAVDLSYIYVAGYDSSQGSSNMQWRVEKRDKTTGALVTAFDTDGVMESNPSTSSDYAYSIEVDSDYIYVAGVDFSPINFQWRVQKHDKNNGALVSAFDGDGILVSNPSTGNDYARSIAVDSSNIYVAGYDYSPGNLQWRVEKRDKATGALVTAFNTTGIIQSNPSAGSDSAYSIAVDSDYIYVTGIDNSLGNLQWRVEKRDKTTGALVTAFDTDGIVESNPSSGADYAYSIVIDTSNIFIVGYEYAPANYQWRIEKRNKSTGALAMGFNYTGVIQSNPSSQSDIARSIAQDSNYIYIAGYDLSPGNFQWRVEKREKVTGSLVTSFDSDGIVESNPSTFSDYATSIAVDAGYVYIAGFDKSPVDRQWRIEKRDKTTGALVTGFNGSGIVNSNPSSGDDSAYSIAVDSDYIYIAGCDRYWGTNDQWRVEKRYKDNGSLVLAFSNDGIVKSNPSGGNDQAYSIAVDSNYIYVAGFYYPGDYSWRLEKFNKATGFLEKTIVSNPSTGHEIAESIAIDSDFIYLAGSNGSHWRLEKRDKVSCSLETSFDIDGVVESNLGTFISKLYSVTVDSDFIYIAGYNSYLGNPQFCIEKRYKTTGALVSEFGKDGAVKSNPSPGDDIIYSVIVDSSYVFVAGIDETEGSYYQWRVEKYKNHVFPENGIYTSPIIDASGADNVIWSTISWDSEVLPPETMVKFQLAVCNDGITWEYLGPDGTEDTYYETAAGQLIWSGMSGQYMKYRAYFSTTNTGSTPTLNDVKIVYYKEEIEPPTVTLTSPNGGEDWMRNNWYPITWNAEGVFDSEPIDLLYSVDNGANWTKIAKGIYNTGFYNWTVPNIETANALILVRATDIYGNRVRDTSDASFAIDPPPPGADDVSAGGGGSQFPPDEQPGAGEEPTGDSGNSRAPKGLEPGLVAGVIALLISIIIILILTIFFVTRSKRSKNNQDNKEINQKVRSKISIENLKDKGESR